MASEVRRAAKKDANHDDVADGLRANGYSFLDLHQSGNGIPDGIAGAYHFACLVEIKDGSKPPSDRLLTPAQERVLSNWTGPKVVVTSLEDALQQLAALREKCRCA